MTALNKLELSVLQDKLNRYSDIIKEKHRKPKSERKLLILAEAKKRKETIERWIKNN